MEPNSYYHSRLLWNWGLWQSTTIPLTLELGPRLSNQVLSYPGHIFFWSESVYSSAVDRFWKKTLHFRHWLQNIPRDFCFLIKDGTASNSWAGDCEENDKLSFYTPLVDHLQALLSFQSPSYFLDFFNGLPAFVGFSVPNPSLEKNIGNTI